MKYSMKCVLLRTNPWQVFLWGFVLFSVVLLDASGSRSQVGCGSSAQLKSVRTSQQRETPTPETHLGALSCPPPHTPSSQGSQSRPSHHKVTLSWIAAPSSAHRGGDVAGYCLYRSKIQYVAKQDPLCAECEQVNSIPVKGVSCVDEVVDASTTYYYVVTAINREQNISSTSNEAKAPIPTADHPSSSASGSPPPSCREVSTKR